MTRFGFYNYDYRLDWVLMEAYPNVSNRQLLHELLLAPLRDIELDLKQGRTHPYALRERHRQWVDRMTSEFGSWLELPDWGDVEHDGPHDCGICEHLFEEPAEWTLYGDSSEMAFELVGQLRGGVLLHDDASSVIKALLTTYPGDEDLILLVPDVGFYVVRSNKTEDCQLVVPSPHGWHPFQDIAFAEAEGNAPAYVLPDDIVTSWAEEVRLEELDSQEASSA